MTSSTHVIEFTLGEDRYCVSIDSVETVMRLDSSSMTNVPNSPPHIAGIVDLRGEATRIINPKRLLDAPDTTLGEKMIVFDVVGDNEKHGWAVDSVDQVNSISTDNIDEQTDSDALKGIVNREDGFVLWAKPDLALA